jgi:hypothetical protein
VTAARRRTSVPKAILAAGALAGAVGSILGLGSTVASVFTPAPEGTVKSLRIQSIRPLNYGGWRDHEGASRTGVRAAQLRVPGKLITFDIETSGFDDDDELPVRIIVHDLTHDRHPTLLTDPARVRSGKDCGCFDWVAVPRGRTRYFIEVAVFPPGPIRGDPLRTVASAYFGAEAGARRS